MRRVGLSVLPAKDKIFNPTDDIDPSKKNPGTKFPPTKTKQTTLTHQQTQGLDFSEHSKQSLKQFCASQYKPRILSV